MDEQPKGLSFAALATISRARCEAQFAPIDEWTPWDWSNAMAGEVGEACAEGLTLLAALSASSGKVCNLTKKMARIWPGNQFQQSFNKPEDERIEELRERMALELGDVVLYAELLAQRVGKTLEWCVTEAFNRKSDQIHSTFKIAVDTDTP